MTALRLGGGDNPTELDVVWLEFCDDGHSGIYYFLGAIPTPEQHGNCPACAAIAAANQERKRRSTAVGR